MKINFKSGAVLPAVLTLGVAAALAAWLWLTLCDAPRSSSEAGRLAAENAVKRAALACYAIEGAYPESYAYIADRYGVAVDTSRYIVHYEIFASNIMPDIAVLAVGGDG